MDTKKSNHPKVTIKGEAVRYWAVYGGHWITQSILQVPAYELAAMTASDRARVISAQNKARKERAEK